MDRAPRGDEAADVVAFRAAGRAVMAHAQGRSFRFVSVLPESAGAAGAAGDRPADWAGHIAWGTPTAFPASPHDFFGRLLRARESALTDFAGVAAVRLKFGAPSGLERVRELDRAAERVRDVERVGGQGEPTEAAVVFGVRRTLRMATVVLTRLWPAVEALAARLATEGTVAAADVGTLVEEARAAPSP